MIGHPQSSRLGRRVARLLPLWIVLGTTVGAAQLEQGVAERNRQLAGLEIPSETLERHLLDRQQLVVWLPVGYEPLSKTNSSRFVHPSQGATLTFGRYETQPGASILHIAERLIRDLEANGTLQTIHTVRRMRIADRPAVEMTGIASIDGETGLLRLAVVMDPGDSHHRSLSMFLPTESPTTAAAAADALFLRTVRDWTPLDGGIWTPTFERRREALVGSESRTDWDRRNRSLARIARPEALGEAWSSELGSEWTDDSLIDALLHHHPRVRIAGIEAIASFFVGSPEAQDLLYHCLRDSDPPVRLRAARVAVAQPEVATRLASRLLQGNDSESRGGAFQLLSLLPSAGRVDTLLEIFSNRGDFSPENRTFLTALLTHWGTRSEREEFVAATLHEAWKFQRDDAQRAAFLRALLELGHSEALGLARQRLTTPDTEAVLSIEEATLALAIFSPFEELESLRSLAEPYAARPGPSPTGTPAKVDPPALDERPVEDDYDPGPTLRSLIEFLEEVPDGTARAECAALTRQYEPGTWLAARFRRLGCDPIPVAELLQVRVKRPGAFLQALLQFLHQLNVGQRADDEAYHAAFDQFADRLEHWAGDPVSMASTGADLSAPLEFATWMDAGGKETRIDDLPLGGTALRLRGAHPATLVDSFLRLSDRSVGVRKLTVGALAVPSTPLLPLAMLAVWSDLYSATMGEDESDSEPLPSDRYVALSAIPEPSEDHDAEILVLEIDHDGRASWNATRLSHASGTTQATETKEPDRFEPIPTIPLSLPSALAEPRTESRSPSASIDLDLTAFFSYFAPSDPAKAWNPPDGLRMAIESHFEGPLVRSPFAADGFPDSWKAVLLDRPTNSWRAPEDLLPADTLAWVVANTDPIALRQLFEEEGGLLAELSKRHRNRASRVLEAITGEIGIAVVGLPEATRVEPSAEESSRRERWAAHIVLFFAVDPAEAERLLRKNSQRSSKADGLRIYEVDSLSAARIGSFITLSEDPAVLHRLAKETRLRETEAYEEVLARTPASTALVGGFDTHRLAEELRGPLAEREDFSNAFVVEVFSALGRVGAWVQASPSSLAGEVSVLSRAHPEDEDRQPRSGFSGFTSGSVVITWPPTGALAEPYSSIQFALKLPEDREDEALDWSNERLTQTMVDSRHYRFVSEAGISFPTETALTLPLSDPDGVLRAYLRNEHNLDLHLDEVQELAESIRGDANDPAVIVRKIVDWAQSSLEYSVIRRSPSVEEILLTRQADCTEFSQLTVALARSLGIPARPVSGVHLGSEGAILHQWTEVFLDRWYEIDSTFGVVEVPAAHIRLPGRYGGFLATAQGSRFDVDRLTAGDSWVRRVIPPLAGLPSRDLRLAVSGADILIQAVGDEATLGWLSKDQGLSFVPLPPSDLSGTVVQLLGGSEGFLRIHRVEDQLVFYRLDANRSWAAVPSPPGLFGEEPARFAPSTDGYLALTQGAPPRLFWIATDLSESREVPLPGDGGTWTLAENAPILGRTHGREGVVLHTLGIDGWEAPARVIDSKNLRVREVRSAGEAVEVVLEDERLKSSIPFVVRLVDGEQSKRSDTGPRAPADRSVLDSRGNRWSLWVEGEDTYLAATRLGDR